MYKKLSANSDANWFFLRGAYFAAIKQYELAIMKFCDALKIDPNFKLAEREYKRVDKLYREAIYGKEKKTKAKGKKRIKR